MNFSIFNASYINIRFRTISPNLHFIILNGYPPTDREECISVTQLPFYICKV